ncbi:hypothetical protein OF83DRAFT_1086972 [Amylostereum chailletii]|nr:hypothetical protein OF83DRAFT_1086972 [Amylostereum chailletii]
MSQETSAGGPRDTSGFKFTTIKRGWSAEGDRVLDYLDEKDPNNIVEAYTFNFKDAGAALSLPQYHRVPGTDTIVPIMSLGKEMTNLSLGRRKMSKDPATQAALEGRTPTLGDVKKSIKTLVKMLISTMNNMDKLPRRRFVTYKVFYNSHTPASYEPPGFKSGDPDKEHFFFTTHETDEVPEKWNIGNLETGWHGLDLHVASVSNVLPTEKNDEPWTDADVQKRDARHRRIAWDAERLGRMDSLDNDAEGSPDPEYTETVDNSGVGSEPWMPMGYRTNDGDIVPLSMDERRAYARNSDKDSMDIDNPDDMTTQEMRQKELRRSRGTLTQTQKLNALHSKASLSIRTHSQFRTPLPKSSFNRISPLPPSDIPSLSTVSQMEVDRTPPDRQMQNHDDISDSETRTQGMSAADDPIESFPNASPSPEGDIVPSRPRNEAKTIQVKEIVECDCSVTAVRLLISTFQHVLMKRTWQPEGAECILCEGGCGKWFHVWYHTARDKRLPNKFACFHCRLEGDDNWEYIRIQSWFTEMVDKFPRLALFRRAIKLAEKHEPESLKDFTQLIQCEPLEAGQLFRRLESEGFIAPQTDLEFGLDSLPGKKGRGNGKKKQPKARKSMQKTKYLFVRSVKRTSAYRDYFDPDMSVQMRVMGVSTDQLASTPRRRTHAQRLTPEPETPGPLASAQALAAESQTQAESVVALKRKAVAGDPSRVSKKLKMSVATEPVDLCDR